MKNNSFGEKILIVVIIVGILYIIGSAVDASKSKSVKSGCNNERSSGSAYCFLHKPYENSSYKNSYSSTTRTTTESTTEVTTKTTERATTSVTTREEPTTRAWKDNNSYKNNTSGNPYKSYDDGYDDVYMDGDYDDARYNSDSDYVRTERCTDRGFVCSGTDENGRRKACTCRCGNRGMCDNCDTP